MIKALHARPEPNLPSQECALKVSVQPLRLNIDQVLQFTWSAQLSTAVPVVPWKPQGLVDSTHTVMCEWHGTAHHNVQLTNHWSVRAATCWMFPPWNFNLESSVLEAGVIIPTPFLGCAVLPENLLPRDQQQRGGPSTQSQLIPSPLWQSFPRAAPQGYHSSTPSRHAGWPTSLCHASR